ncbi:tannase/feruloyl esterase family alpha/beta hydrolase (plasmid) [Paraburkholderia sprentiae WSM5005]|uniref:Tannase/feruloyl esterase family alpha/beta hydrolase n=1 Tax=Paraburkholderia sprentiae WSM5005 TaxID=754502 RepID=A0ACA8AX98_9BURK|nr:tannase/feruloyl esterase family alpha/beta hydrolase [Paraburkholderia sprentiae]APA90334.2 tannase/feruloyl esterase family alpha/beta hydrolase [Paraburkholderia sprentiae WSM5005]
MNVRISAIASVAVSLMTVGCGDGGVQTASPQQPTLAEMCTTSTMQKAMPTGVTVKDIPNLWTSLPAVFRATKGGVNLLAENALGDGAPAYCLVTGSFVTNSVTGKTANFAAGFPAADKWNGKYLQIGCGGNCGNVGESGAPNPAHLRAGFAVWQTDDGHVDGSIAATGTSLESDSSWAVSSPGVQNTDAVQDYLHRAVHTMAVLGQHATASAYNVQTVKRSYFMGCSDGGREAMVEATKYPLDFDGIVAGAPYNPRKNHPNFMTRALVQLRGTSAQLSGAQMKLVASAMTTACDAADGVTDGLIQNPNACNFNPRKDIPMCAAGAAGSDSCLSSDQIDSVAAIVSAARDQTGSILAAGWSPGTLADAADTAAFPSQPAAGPDPFGPQPYLTMFNDWAFSNYTLKNIVFNGDPKYDGRTTLGQTFGLSDPADPSTFHVTFPSQTTGAIQNAFLNGTWDDPAALAPFIQKGGKLFMYHGLTDPYLNANNTVTYYENLASAEGGFAALKKNVRLFLAPGMDHCQGGAGPNAFVSQYQQFSPTIPFDPQHDALASLDNWVGTGQAPDSIIATKYTDDDSTKPVSRTMPLCPFPAQAHYSGSGSPADAANWSCADGDNSMLRLGTAGTLAGMQ